MFQYTTNGIKFTQYDLGSLGAKFILYPDPEHTSEQITAAKNELCRNQDAASLHVASEDDRDFLYKFEIFRQPEMKGLCWYQINIDPELIRGERLKGTSVKDYVKTFILPFVKVTEENNLQQFGNKIYEI